MNYIVTFYSWDEDVVYEYRHYQCNSFEELKSLADARCEELVKKTGEPMCWHWEEDSYYA